MSLLWVVWLVGAVGLAIAELHSGDFTLLMLAGGCLFGLFAALIIPAFWAQAIIAALSTALLLWVLRPTLLHRVRSMPGYRSSLDRMVGSSGLVTQAITADAGEVKIDGEVWSARSLEGTPIAADQEIDVYGIDGTYLLVVPRSAVPPTYLAPAMPQAPQPGPGPVMAPPPSAVPPAGPGFGMPQPGYLGLPPATDSPDDYWARPQG